MSILIPSPKAVPKSRSSNFDKLSFAKYMKNIGRAYRKQAMELISISRNFVQVGQRSVPQDARLRTVLEVIDKALSSAADTRNKSSKETDKKFERAINELNAYEQKYHPNYRIVDKKMTSAKEKDKSSSTALNRLKQCFEAKPVEGQTKEARFLLPGSLLDPDPKVVKQALCEQSNVHEILWNFSRLEGDKRITLKQNPCFYRGLPRSPDAFGGEFKIDPLMERFWDAREIWVLTDKQSRVFLETGEKKRVFGNFWMPGGAIIFKEIGGRLEGEGIVSNYIQGIPNLWHREEPTVIPSPATTGPASPSDLTGRVFEDWRQLIRDALNSPNISIRISTKCTLPESQNNWVPSSPTSPNPGSLAQSFSTMQLRSSAPTVLSQLPTIRIPEPSPGPQSALSYKTARSTDSPLSQTSPTVIKPPFAPRSTLGPREPPAEVPPSPARPTPISQNPVAVSLSVSVLTVATLTPQARPSPTAAPHRPGPPQQQATSTGAAPMSSRTITSGGIAPSASTTPTPPTNDLARSSGLHPGDSPVGNRTSVPDSVSATSKAQAPIPGQKQAESAAAPAKGPAQTQEKKKNWFRTYIWDYGKGK